MRSVLLWLVTAAVVGVACIGLLRREREVTVAENFPAFSDDAATDTGSQLATFGNGCFWCTEAVFQQIKGVEKVVSGYSGGAEKNPTYKQVCSGTTGHAEVIQITFDPKQVSYATLLEAFWRTHDPTTKNRQGNDVGPQYRSVIFTHTEKQRELAEKYKARLDEAGVFPRPIVTEVVPFTEFWPAEDYHQNYFADNPTQPYCRAMIPPKLDKLKKVFAEKMK